MKLLVTGGDGQVGRALASIDRDDISIDALGRNELDICAAAAVRACLASRKPDVVVNAAAYTAVDQAETEREQAFAVNAEAVRNLAAACAEQHCRLIQISTDFVFSGNASRPYRPDDEPNPLGVYGASKLAGEKAALTLPAKQVIVLRSAWVYASEGKNFVNTMLRLMAEKESISVVNDQRGCPTWANSIAFACLALARKKEAQGILHWTDRGEITWYEFAVAIQQEALDCGLLNSEIPISPIESKDYPTPAKRPAFSVLDCSATEALLQHNTIDWRDNLKSMLKEKRHA